MFDEARVRVTSPAMVKKNFMMLVVLDMKSKVETFQLSWSILFNYNGKEQHLAYTYTFVLFVFPYCQGAAPFQI